MGSLEKQGLCNHCGVISTTQWRKGPPAKPVLCNTCGSRYRLNGSLENYALTCHFRGPLPKRPRKPSDANAIVQNEENVSSCASCSTGSADDTTANKYTSLSATSHDLQNCTELKKVDGDQISGNSQPHLLDFSGFPARNRPATTFSDLSHIESLQTDPVYTVEHDPEASESAEDVVLIYNANSLWVSPNEIGLGCVLLKPPSSNVNPKDGPTDESQA